MLSVFTNCVMDDLCFFKLFWKVVLCLFRPLSTMCMNWLTNGTHKDALLGARFWFRSLVRMAGQRQLTQNYCHNFHWQDEVTIDKTACCREHQWSFQQITTEATSMTLTQEWWWKYSCVWWPRIDKTLQSCFNLPSLAQTQNKPRKAICKVIQTL